MFDRLSYRYMESNPVAFLFFSFHMWSKKILKAYWIAPKAARQRAHLSPRVK